MPSSPRVHVVLVPGFAGFDALGQLEYYADVTRRFRTWAQRAHLPAEIHYFDNLPTAGVATRAERLRKFLAKRWARGTFQKHDVVTLVGHSTGGLDIRRLLLDLQRLENEAVDGAASQATEVPTSTLWPRRVVFLSVPQIGTNIADFVKDNELVRKWVLDLLRAGVAGAENPAMDLLETWLARVTADATGANLLLAVQDALREIDAGAVHDHPVLEAAAHEAAAELALWLRHMAADFRAIDDLTVRRPDPCDQDDDRQACSPAHRTADERAQELQLWRAQDIRTLSLATLGRRAFELEPGRPAPTLSPWRPGTWPLHGHAADLPSAVDPVYLACYRACAGGPFDPGPDWPTQATDFFSGEGRMLETWDNDGIVNTRSMLWPHGRDTLLIDADHADILGHFRLVAAKDQALRTYHTYDLLGSASGFGADGFDKVWQAVFDFCAGGQHKTSETLDSHADLRRKTAPVE